MSPEGSGSWSVCVYLCEPCGMCACMSDVVCRRVSVHVCVCGD